MLYYDKIIEINKELSIFFIKTLKLRALALHTIDSRKLMFEGEKLWLNE